MSAIREMRSRKKEKKKTTPAISSVASCRVLLDAWLTFHHLQNDAALLCSTSTDASNLRDGVQAP